VGGGGPSVGLVCGGSVIMYKSAVEREREAGAGGRYFFG
jgi:hypothetical protein